MIHANDNFQSLERNYLFTEIGRRVKAYADSLPELPLIRMDIGDVSRPLAPACIEALLRGADELSHPLTFKGYGPEHGYMFLREAICANDYARALYKPMPDEVFISDGAKCDLGNILDIISPEASIAFTDPGYPVYADDAVMEGRRTIRLMCTAENDFRPELPAEAPGVIILCYPNNPTGTVLSREELQKWVDYAAEHGCLLIYDSAYCAYVSSDAPRSIYECREAERVAIEIRSYSKTAGFTGVRCGYTIVPMALKAKYSDGREVSLNSLWNRRQCTKFNGAGYLAQLAAAAIYTPEGKQQIQADIDCYMGNARKIRQTLTDYGLRCFGGEDSPYVWVAVPDGFTSDSFFEKLLCEAGVSCTPGSGFGAGGEGYIRMTGFNFPEATEEALGRIKRLFNNFFKTIIYR